jgi:hypothetical protein
MPGFKSHALCSFPVIEEKNMKTILLFTAISLNLPALTQIRKNTLNLGATISTPFKSHEINKTTGYGIYLRGEHSLSRNLSVTARAGYTFYKGDINYFDNTHHKNFALMPLLLGTSLTIKKIYFGIELGTVLPVNMAVNSHFAFSPGAGFRFNRLAIGLDLLIVPEVPSLPENSFLQKGGFSYGGINLSYRL